MQLLSPPETFWVAIIFTEPLKDATLRATGAIASPILRVQNPIGRRMPMLTISGDRYLRTCGIQFFQRLAAMRVTVHLCLT